MSMKGVYDRLYSDSSYAKSVNRQQFDWLMRRPLAGIKTAVDFGCGTGHVVRALRVRGIETTGVDFSSALESRDWEGDPLFVRGDVGYVDIGGTRDLVVCHDVLEHLPDSESARALDNLAAHTGKFASLCIANHSDVQNGVELHVNNQALGWWLSRIDARWDVEESKGVLGGRLHLFWCRAK